MDIYKKSGAVEREHAGNKLTREDVRVADNKSSPLTRAFANSSIKTDRPVLKDSGEPKGSELLQPKGNISSPKNDGSVTTHSASPTPVQKPSNGHRTSDIGKQVNEKPFSGHRTSDIGKGETGVGKNQFVAHSTYVASVNNASPLDQVLKNKNTPATPPKEETKKGNTDAAGKSQPDLAELREAVATAKGVPAPLAQQGGAKAGAENREPKTENGERKTGERKTEGGKRSGGAKGSSAILEQGNAGNGSLEASSGGVAGGSGGETQSIADMAPAASYTVNPDPIYANLDKVRMASDEFKKNLLKVIDMPPYVAQVFENAVHLDDKLTEILERGLAARLNVNGGMNG
ncbi:MAG: hypothetical protein Q7T03_00620 [Deltaproteobacteria bacterium]|nr:hypothetical protein [Deltaproteobacteria bacterium]